MPTLATKIQTSRCLNTQRITKSIIYLFLKVHQIVSKEILTIHFQLNRLEPFIIFKHCHCFADYCIINQTKVLE